MNVRVGTRLLQLSAHAVERYQERVRPALDEARVRVELDQLLRGAGIVDCAPAWVREREADEWVVLSDEIVFPVEDGVLVSALTRGALGDDARAVRSERKQRKRQSRKGGHNRFHGKVAKSESARARASREADWR